MSIRICYAVFVDFQHTSQRPCKEDFHLVTATEELLTTPIPLRLARAQLGLSQTDLARLANVHRTTLRNCELGEPIRLETAWKILNALNAERRHQLKSRLTIDQLTWNVKP